MSIKIMKVKIIHNLTCEYLSRPYYSRGLLDFAFRRGFFFGGLLMGLTSKIR